MSKRTKFLVSIIVSFAVLIISTSNDLILLLSLKKLYQSDKVFLI